MRGVPDGYLDRRDFVRAVGERSVPGWDGTEERAWPLSAYADFVAAIGETEAAVVYQIRVQSGIDQARAAPAPPAAKASPCANCGAPSTKIMDGRPYCDAHGTQPPIPERLRALMEQDPPIARMRTAEMAEAGREILSADAKRIHQPERLARERWNRAEAAVRDLVLAGKIRP